MPKITKIKEIPSKIKIIKELPIETELEQGISEASKEITESDTLENLEAPIIHTTQSTQETQETEERTVEQQVRERQVAAAPEGARLYEMARNLANEPRYASIMANQRVTSKPLEAPEVGRDFQMQQQNVFNLPENRAVRQTERFEREEREFERTYDASLTAAAKRRREAHEGG